MGHVWETYLRISGWISEYESVNKLLSYLRVRKSGSEASKCTFCSAVYNLCIYSGKTPDEFVSMKKADVERLVQDFCDDRRRKRSAGYANNTQALLITFFRLNGFKGTEELELQGYYQPSRSRERPEYIPSLEEALRMANVGGDLRNRAIILVLLSTGLRNSTLRAILYGEIKEELEKGPDNILIRVHEEMKKRVPEACKNRIEYFVFTCREATEALRHYMKGRAARFGGIEDDEFLFVSSGGGYNKLSRRERLHTPMQNRGLQMAVKKAARRAGIKEWVHVTPKSLRKTFESVLRSRLIDGDRLDIKTQEFFMGHILPGSQDPYFDKTKIEEMRAKYSRLSFTPYREGSQVTSESLQVIAEALGVDLSLLRESKKEGPGSELGFREKVQFLREAIRQNMQMNNKREKPEWKMVSQEELMTYLNEGWDMYGQLKDGVIVRRQISDTPRRELFNLRDASLTAGTTPEERKCMHATDFYPRENAAQDREQTFSEPKRTRPNSKWKGIRQTSLGSYVESPESPKEEKLCTSAKERTKAVQKTAGVGSIIEVTLDRFAE